MPAWFRRDLTVGDRGRDVVVVARKLGFPGDVFTVDHAALVRGMQRTLGLPVTGVVDELTAGAFGEAADVDLPPDWWHGVVAPSDPEYSVLTARFGLDESAVRRLQGSSGLRPTGLIDEALALVLDGLA